MIPAARVLAWSININIRPAQLSDARLIADANVALARETEDRQLDPARVTAGVTALLNDPAKGIYFVAEADRAFAGQLLLTYEWSDWRNGNFWWIQSVYVVESHRGRGIFRALFQHVHALARARKDVCGLRLYMDADNARARRAYDLAGLKHTNYEVFEMDFTHG